MRDIYNIAAHDRRRGEVVMTIPVWDFNWQRTYSFAQPLIVERGQALLATAEWDNSRDNPRNPDWREDVPWGLQTHHEMFHTLFLYEELEDDDPQLAKHPAQAND